MDAGPSVLLDIFHTSGHNVSFKLQVQKMLNCCGFKNQDLLLSDPSGMGHPACEAVSVFLHSFDKQECMLVGWVPSAAVAISPATYKSPPPCTPLCHASPTRIPPTMHALLPCHADRCENITFPQLFHNYCCGR